MTLIKWKIEYIKEAQRDLKRLAPDNRKIILKAIDRTAERPLPPPDGIGKPLGNHASSRLNGYYKIKLRDLGYRIVYQLIKAGETMRIIINPFETTTRYIKKRREESVGLRRQ